MNFYCQEFKNRDIEENYIEFKRKASTVSQKWVAILMSLFLFGFNYFSSQDKQIFTPLNFYLIHFYADLLFVFGILMFFDANLPYDHILKRAVFLYFSFEIKSFKIIK